MEESGLLAAVLIVVNLYITNRHQNDLKCLSKSITGLGGSTLGGNILKYTKVYPIVYYKAAEKGVGKVSLHNWT